MEFMKLQMVYVHVEAENSSEQIKSGTANQFYARCGSIDQNT